METKSLESVATTINNWGHGFCERARSLNLKRLKIQSLIDSEDDSINATVKYERFQPMKDSYVLEVQAFAREMTKFLKLLSRTDDILKHNALAVKSTETMEISSNHSESGSPSPVAKVPMPDSAYSQDDAESDNSNNVAVSVSPKSSTPKSGVPEPVQEMVHRENVDHSARTQNEPIAVAQMTQSIPIVAENKELPALPRSVHATPKPTEMKPKDVVPKSRPSVIRKKVRFSIDVTKTVKEPPRSSQKKSQQKSQQKKGKQLYTTTELYCKEPFGGNTKELRRHLIGKGGFHRKDIKSIEVFPVKDREKKKLVYHARLFVYGKRRYILDKIDRVESSRGIEKKNVIWISTMERHKRSNKLMVRNFDVLNGNNHQRMAELFSTFGPLERDVKIGRNRDGINTAVVTFRDMEDARICERFQNDIKFRRNMGRSRGLSFNGRILQIGYADNDQKKTNSRKTQRKNKGQKLELHCTKTFGGDAKKLRRYFVAKGGFSNKQIESIKVYEVLDPAKKKLFFHAKMIMNGNAKAIRDKIDQLESAIKEVIIYSVTPVEKNDRRSKTQRNTKNRKTKRKNRKE